MIIKSPTTLEAVSRDFGLSKEYIHDLLAVVKIFKKSEILDSVYFSCYGALKEKRKDLARPELFEKKAPRHTWKNQLAWKRKIQKGIT